MELFCSILAQLLLSDKPFYFYKVPIISLYTYTYTTSLLSIYKFHKIRHPNNDHQLPLSNSIRWSKANYRMHYFQSKLTMLMFRTLSINLPALATNYQIHHEIRCRIHTSSQNISILYSKTLSKNGSGMGQIPFNLP